VILNGTQPQKVSFVDSYSGFNILKLTQDMDQYTFTPEQCWKTLILEEQAEKPDTGEGETEKPDTGEGETEKPDTGESGTEKPDTGEGETEKPDTGEGGTEKPDTGEGGTEKPDTGEGETEKPDTVEGGTEKPDTGEGGTGKPNEEQPAQEAQTGISVGVQEDCTVQTTDDSTLSEEETEKILQEFQSEEAEQESNANQAVSKEKLAEQIANQSETVETAEQVDMQKVKIITEAKVIGAVVTPDAEGGYSIVKTTYEITLKAYYQDSTEVAISNEMLNGAAIKIRLDVPSGVKARYATITHAGDPTVQVEVQRDAEVPYIEFTATHFSQFDVDYTDKALSSQGSAGQGDKEETDPSTGGGKQQNTTGGAAQPSGGSDGAMLLVLGAGAAAAATAAVVYMLPVEVSGTVLDAQGKVVANAEVAIEKDGKVVAQTVTDANGAYALKVRRGSYELVVRCADAAGNRSEKQRVAIKAPDRSHSIRLEAAKQAA
jgi:hypothetical protein